MKYLLILLAIICLTVPIKAQDSTKITAKQVYEDVKEGFTKLVNNLEGPAKHVYGVYIKQHKTKGATKGVVTIFGLLVTSLFLFCSLNKADWDKGNVYSVFTIFGGIGLFIALISTALYLCGDFNKLLNPEYYAIQDIIDALK